MSQSISKKALDHINVIEDHFYFIDSDWTILNLNEAAAEYLGAPREEIEGGSVWDYFPVNEGMIFPVHMRNAMKNKSTERWEDFRPSVNHWFQSSAFGTENGMIVICKDITREKAALDELKDIKDKLAAVFDSMSEGYALLDKSGKILAFNQTLFQDVKLAKSIELQEGNKFIDYSLFFEQSEFESYFSNALKGEVLKFEVKFTGEQKIGIWYRVMMHPVYSTSGALLGVSYSHSCIDDIMNVQEKLLRKNKLLEEVSWKQAHEVRGSMVKIMGLFDLMKSVDCDSAEKENYYQHIDNSIRELDEIVQGIILKSSN